MFNSSRLTVLGICLRACLILAGWLYLGFADTYKIRCDSLEITGTGDVTTVEPPQHSPCTKHFCLAKE